MPINANGQLITAINCEGREIVRAHAGLDLVWQKAITPSLPDGFVQINGLNWSTFFLMADLPYLGVKQGFPFPGFEVHYFNNAEALACISAKYGSDYRLPTRAEVEALDQHLITLYPGGGITSLADGNIAHWQGVTAKNINAYGFAAMGTTMMEYNSLFVPKYFFYAMIAAYGSSPVYWFRFRWDQAFTIFGYSAISVRVPVRLIYDPQ